MIAFLYLFIAFHTALYSSPPSFEYHELITSDNTKIRVGRFCGENAVSADTEKALLVLPGLVSRIERQEFLAKQLALHGYDIWILEFRGQGDSQRFVDNKQMIHIDDFSQYIIDVETLAAFDQLKNKQLSIYGHSMGGQVALQMLRKHPTRFNLAVLEAPMIRINTSPFPFFLAEPLAYIFKNWFGKSKQYCITCSDYDPIKQNFDHNLNCREKDLFDQYYYISESKKELIPSNPSFGWMHAALSSTRHFLNNLYLLKPITTKIFFATAGNDKVLDTTHDKTVASSITHAVHKVYSHSYHSLLHDSLTVRNAFLSDISSFLKNPEDFLRNAQRTVISSSNTFANWLFKLLHFWYV